MVNILDWKICAAEDLRKYRHMKLGLINSRERLQIIRQRVRSLKNSLHRTYQKTDTEYVNAIVEAERIKTNIKHCENLIDMIDRGLNTLAYDERKVLEEFYMKTTPPNIVDLKARLGYETRTIYRLRDTALEKFTLTMYGISES